jgi:hypothetical protein
MYNIPAYKLKGSNSCIWEDNSGGNTSNQIVVSGSTFYYLLSTVFFLFIFKILEVYGGFWFFFSLSLICQCFYYFIMLYVWPQIYCKVYLPTSLREVTLVFGKITLEENPKYPINVMYKIPTYRLKGSNSCIWEDNCDTN